MLNWAVRHRPIVIFGCIVFFVVSLFCAKSIGTEFFPAQDNARIAVQLELPIGTRKELAQEVSEKLTNQWLNKYKGVMTVCNYTVGQADSDNTWASMQDNVPTSFRSISVWSIRAIVTSVLNKSATRCVKTEEISGVQQSTGDPGW